MTGTLFFKQREKTIDADTQVFERAPSPTLSDRSRVKMIFMLSPDEITPNPSQPRRFFTDDAILRLADSIRLHGIIQPLAVRRPERGEGYELVAGERRLRAAKRLGLSEVPCVLVNADSEESAHMAIVENIQRENLNMFEQAEAIYTLMQVHCLTQEKIAEQLSCSQSYVANKLRLLRIPDEDKSEILSASLTERHVRALLRIKDPDRRRLAMHTIIRRSMNVAAAEEYIDSLMEADKKSAQPEKERTSRIFVRDVRILYNTIDRAVETVRLSGIDIETERLERADDTRIVITIPKVSQRI
ncbi:MAG: ParB/RepB/Spo0J family partition protein [Clostridia bacterium]|nr:ParB/RepB/Spo0J family partition protein [Clostridia bacterium]